MIKLLQALLVIASVVFYGLDMIEVERAIYIAIISICLKIFETNEGGEE